MVTATSAQKQGGFFVKSRALLLFLIFFIALILFIVAAVHYNSATHFTTSDGGSLTISGAPGELVTVTINVGSSVNGHWASQGGLTLTLNSPSNASTLVVAPRDPDWSDTISTTADNPDSDILLTGTFMLPTNIHTVGQTISGQISGDVEYPADEGFAFTDSNKSVSIPVQLILIDASSSFLTTQLPLYTITGLGIALLLIFPAIFRFYDIRRKPSFYSM